MASGPEVTAALKLRDDMSPGLAAAKTNVGGFASFVSNAAATMTGFLGAEIVNNIKNFIGGSVAARAESDKLLAQTVAVIRSTGGVAKVSAEDVDTLAQAISRYSGVDDEAIAKGENLLLTFTNIRNAAGKGNDIFNRTTKIMVDMSKALGTDAAGSAIQLGKALNDPIKGITALTRVGVTFSDEQKKQIKNFMDHNNLIGAQKIILAELSREFGDSARAYGDSSAGMMDKMRVAIGNAQEAMGGLILILLGELAPSITGAAHAIETFLLSNARLFQRVAELMGLGISRFFGGLRDVIGQVVDKARPLAGLLTDVKNAVSGDFLKVFQWFVDNRDTVAVGLGTFATTVAVLATGGKVLALAGQLQSLAAGFLAVAESEGAMAAIAGLVGGTAALVALIVAGVAAAVYFLYQNVPQVHDALDALGGWIMNEGAAAFGALQQMWQDIQPAVQAVIDTTLSVLSQLGPAFDDLKAAAADVWAQLQVLWDEVMVDLMPAFLELWAALQPLIQDLVRALRPALEALGPILKQMAGAFIALTFAGLETLAFILRLVAQSIALVTAMLRIKDAIVAAAVAMFVQAGDNLAKIITLFRGLPAKVTTIGHDLVEGLKQGIIDRWRGLVSWLGNLVGMLPEPLKQALGIHSPSRVMYEVGKNFVAGLTGGIEDSWPGLTRLVGGMGSLGSAPMALAGGGVGSLGGRFGGDVHIHIDRGAFIDGVGIDLLTNEVTEALRTRPAR